MATGIFFFFQAEDGIRDYKVTGVQTCALPISCRRIEGPICYGGSKSQGIPTSESSARRTASCRSEERRVGKECRSRWSPHLQKKKKEALPVGVLLPDGGDALGAAPTPGLVNFPRHLGHHDVFFFSSRRRHTRLQGDWSSDVCSSDLPRR